MKTVNQFKQITKMPMARNPLKTLPLCALGFALLVTATARGQDIYVSDLLSGTIGEYTTTGGTVNASLITGLTPYTFGLAVSGNDLFVANYSLGTVGEYD